MSNIMGPTGGWFPAGAKKADSKEAHKGSDVDEDAESQHHTLGDKSTQAAPGNHKHDKLYAPTGLGDTYTANVAGLTPQTYSAVVLVNHTLGKIPSIVVGHIEGTASEGISTWHVYSLSGTQVGIRFYNTHTTANSSPTLKFKVL